MSDFLSSKRILIVDDDEDDYQIMSDYIQSIPGNSLHIKWASNYEDGIRQVRLRKFDMYMVDYRLGAKTGVDFLREASANGVNEPIVLLTGKGNYDIDILAMQLGAVDYIVKTELSIEKLERTIRYALGRSASMKALKEQESKYRRIFERSKDFIFLADARLLILEVNPAITELLGYEAREVRDKSLWEFVAALPKDGGLTDAFFTAIDKEVVLLTKDGQKKYGSLTLTEENPGEKDSNILGIIHDLTNQKVLEKNRIITEKLAATGRLLRTIAHEVRNPLNNITLSLTHLKQTPDDSGLMLDIISRNTDRIGDLITRLLHTSGPVINKIEPVDLRVVVSEVMRVSSDRLSLLSMTSELVLPEASVPVMTDQVNLRLALLNIVTNAIEAMKEGEGRLLVSVITEGDKAILEMSDNGCGIEEENLGRLFEPFYTNKKEGLGLGLAFTMNILRVNNVSVEVTSGIGAGTIFRLTFQKSR